VFDTHNAKVNTSGAYVCVNELYLFAIGIKPHNGNIPVVRIGGHQEGNETGWQCALREVFEETNLQIKPRFPQSTYLYDGDHLEAEPSRIQWQSEIDHEPAPFLVVRYHRDALRTLSLMYFADAEAIPVPSSEVKGLVLLTETDIHRLCHESVTLKEFLETGGKVILNGDFDTSRVLEPFAQLRLLSRILRSQPEKTAA
jgi:8-oxo-dGTP pyrophosphatase MutT (NUDIX family)